MDRRGFYWAPTGPGAPWPARWLSTLDGDPDADPPLRSLWTVTGTVAGAGLAAYVLWRLARRLDRGRQ